MPANAEQLHRAIQEIGKRLAAGVELEASARARALELLRLCSKQPASFREKAERASLADPGLRCALPLTEDPARGYTHEGPLPAHTLLAVDGSQAFPDRHEEVLFGIINVGAVTLAMGTGASASIDVDTTLLYGAELFPDGGPMISEGDLSLRRDAAERLAFIRLTAPAREPSMALVDGPLELWGPKETIASESYGVILERYLRNLRELQQRGWLVAGYVDRPGADLVSRLLEVWEADPQEIKRFAHFHPLQLCTDRWLFSQVLQPGERSAVFALDSSSRLKYTGSVALRFFYLNVGSPGHPVIARVEIPQWVAEDAAGLGVLQAALLDQCHALGIRPYPYILHRAHEVCRLTPAEIEQIKLRLILEARAHGVEPEDRSGKSSAKLASASRGGF